MNHISNNILTDTQYLMYLIKKRRISLEEYEEFCNGNVIFPYIEKINDVWDNNSIDIQPYLFTVDELSRKEFLNFLMFLKHYIDDAEIKSNKIENIITNYKNNENTSSNVDNIVELISENNELLVSLLYIMQYYFL